MPLTGIRFLHTADLHLDTPFKGMAHFPVEHLEKLRNSTFQAFSNLIDYAIETKPDFIVIVGDIYDGENRSLRAQLKFQEGMEALKEAAIPVFLSYGNHDHLKGSWTRFDLPENVHVFKGEIETKSITVRGETVNLYGFSYPERHVREAMIDFYPVAAESNGFHIGLLHGSIDGDESHAVYAPFTKTALLSKQYDYWALGHIHKRQHLNKEPPIVYPGNIQGRHRNEQGDKGFYEVTLSKKEANMQFVRTSTVIFGNLSIACGGIRHAGEWFDICEAALNAFQERSEAAIITLQMTEIDEEAAALFRQSSEEEWLDALRDHLQHHSPFIWINEIRYEREVVKNESMEALLNPVLSTINKWEQEQWNVILSELYQHTRSIKYLDHLTTTDVKEIQAEAEKKLLIELANRK